MKQCKSRSVGYWCWCFLNAHDVQFLSRILFKCTQWSCTVIHVHLVIQFEHSLRLHVHGCWFVPQIWANIHQYEKPAQLTFNLSDTATWRPFFGRGFPSPGLSSIQVWRRLSCVVFVELVESLWVGIGPLFFMQVVTACQESRATVQGRYPKDENGCSCYQPPCEWKR